MRSVQLWSLAANYCKLPSDEGLADPQFEYGVLLSHGSGIPMNKTLAVHYFKLSADQGDPDGQ
jgi:TPR repeat protein